MFVLSFLLRRLLQGALIILLVTFIIFTLLRVVPGDPARLIVGGMAPDEVVAMKAKELGLDRPIPMQFVSYLGDIVTGDLGTSFVRPKSGASLGGASFDDATREERAKVLDLILGTLPMTLQLAAVALALALLVAVPLGTLGGLYPGRWPDKLALAIGSICVSTPNFWLGIVLTLLLSVKLKLLPAIGYRGFSYTILPAIVLAVEIVPFILRTLTVSVAQVMREDFIQLAPIRGLSRSRTILHHALGNSAIPLINLLGVQLGMLLGGVLVIEFIFDYPGLGLLTINAVLQRDFPLIQGIAIFISVMFVMINVLVDLIAMTIDPRLEY
ncbi:ABC transporter permease subunit [Shinella kummerowiae]|uniref:ABC transporter permease subunit n=1 Tax=Shinella kummerowiae TaxID=417745 RepID=A0A6N8SI79_9HYPH|nr:ABC transporter permease [Shinella kummerowiae]MXN46592.1 ABC transporter permease subunit [Shinella kummerowiae]